MGVHIMKKKYLIVLIIVILFIVPTMSIASSFFTENENQPVTSKKLNYIAYGYIYEDTIFPVFNKKRDAHNIMVISHLFILL